MYDLSGCVVYGMEQAVCCACYRIEPSFCMAEVLDGSTFEIQAFVLIAFLGSWYKLYSFKLSA